MKRRLKLLIICCILGMAAHAQESKEGTSLRQRLFPTMKQDIDAINQHANANNKQAVTTPDRPSKDRIFTNYKPAGTTNNAAATTARASKSNAGSTASDKPAAHSNDSMPARLQVPNQGVEGGKKN
ncbi:hypothetical protein [Chitinophaga sp. CB10]|uniref:hypothetical protein n=1 Tax=Chitinophaga sp. CB10 TaxID=1891659 RepID=UPI0025C37A3B|nr:hypothetical protein [Chitinophaga sp. CB10]